MFLMLEGGYMPIDSQVQAILDQFIKFNPQPIERLEPQAARNNPSLKNAVEELAAESIMNRIEGVVKPMPEPVGAITHQVIPAEEPILARIYTPVGTGPFPIIVYFHGGGWVIANLDVYESSCRALCNATESIVVSVAYRQAPEFKYPTAVNDAYEATQWVISHASALGGIPSKVVVFGESAGGNLATVVCLKALEEKGHMPIGQILIYPVTDSRLNTPSMREFTHTVPLYSKMMPWFWNHYLQNEGQKTDVYASPIFAEKLSGLPPTLVITAEYDPLRDEGENYAQKLSEAGISVQSTRYEGMVHEFFGLAGAVSKAKEALTEVADWLKELYKKHE